MDCTKKIVELNENIGDYLKEHGLYSSKTWFYLKMIPREMPLNRNENIEAVVNVEDSLNDEEIGDFMNDDFIDDAQLPEVSPIKRKICAVCSSSYIKDCIRCLQDAEYSASLEVDRLKTDQQDAVPQQSSALSNVQLREARVKAFVPSFSELLSSASSQFKVQKDSYVTFNIRRKNVYGDVLKKMELFFGNKKLCPVRVVFSSLNANEAAVDTGGPGREIVSLFYESCAGKLLYGSENKYCFMHDLQRLNEFKIFGKFVALALLHGYEPPHFLSEELDCILWVSKFYSDSYMKKYFIL